MRNENLIKLLEGIRGYWRLFLVPIVAICFLSIIACKNDAPINNKQMMQIPSTPKGVCRAWQQYLDNNEIAKAMILGSPSAKKWLVDNQSLFLADDEIEPTKFIAIKCTESGAKAICKYTLQEEGDTIEDYFSLVKIKGQWLIHIEDQEEMGAEEATFEQMKKSLDLN